MLVLTRKLQQQIKIGEQITVTILRVKGNTVRLGIQAPRDVRVIRGELPKEGETAETGNAEVKLVESEILPLEIEADCLEETSEVAASELPAGEGEPLVFSARIKAGEATAPLSAMHLPLRRISQRHGSAPLKQLIASCNTLAK